MTTGKLTLTAGNTVATLEAGSLAIDDKVGARSSGSLLIRDEAGALTLAQGTPVVVKDANNRRVVSGFVPKDIEHPNLAFASPGLLHSIDLMDMVYLAEKRRAAASYASKTCGFMANDLLTTYLTAEGVLGTYTQPAFVRASTAYRATDGGQVTSGNPRFEVGTTNLLTGQQSDIETDPLLDPDFKMAGTVISRDATTAWHGSSSLKVFADGGGSFQSASINAPVGQFAANGVYTFSAYMRAASGTPTIRFYCQANDLIAGNASIGTVGSVTLSTTWVRYSFTVTMPGSLAGFSIIGMRADTGGTPQAITWYMDGCQIEVGQVATTWVLGGQPPTSALRIEESTNNVLSANQSSVETGVADFYVIAGATLTQDATQHWTGANSLKVVTPGVATNEGFGAGQLDTAYVAGGKYTASVWLRGAGTVVLKLVDHNVSQLAASANITLTTVWTRYSVSATFPTPLVSGHTYALEVSTVGSIQAVTFYADGLQIEQHPYPTSWQLGGTGRNLESLTLPNLRCISPTEGMIALRAYVDATVRRQVSGNYGHLFGVRNASANDAINLAHDATSANWLLTMGNDAGSQTTATIADSFTPDGWHHFAVCYDASSALLYIDGVLQGTINNPHLSSAMAATWYLGADGGGFSVLNTLYQDVIVSPRKWSANDVATLATATSLASMAPDMTYVVNLSGSLTAGVTIEDGPTVATTTFAYPKVSDALATLATTANFWWNIDAYRIQHFRAYTSMSAPGPVGPSLSEDELALSVERAQPLYRNRQYVVGGYAETSLQTETQKGDGSKRAFLTGYDISQVPTVKVNGVTKTVGILGIDVGKDFYWNSGKNVITQDSAGTVLITTDVLEVDYIGRFPAVYLATDSAGVAGQAATEGGTTTGYVEDVATVSGLSGTNNLAAVANSLLGRYSKAGIRISLRTRQAGWLPGMLGVANFPLHHVSNVQMLLAEVKADDVDGITVWYTHTWLAGPYDNTWPDFWAAMTSQKQLLIDAINLGSSTSLIIPTSVTETWTDTETVTQTVRAALFPSNTLYPANGQYPI
jgi:hypothetical protein